MWLAEIASMFRHIFNWPPSVNGLVDRYFQPGDRSTAKGFYQNWHDSRYLHVQLGDGLHDFSKDGFYAACWVVFLWPPFEADDYLVLATDAEKDTGSVAMCIATGQIVYEYSGSTVELAVSFTDFIQQLRAGGWSG
ncbi:hypothetical protein ETAA8_16000 [Anatilimnocola aggregata]|uniref:Uncharacterized protein n=1 Tax=Anatilimnocola aggregata TaxID=2528021 RepID=A0A517Y8Q6_9BACT|nr:hypothetical protein [Anatilimnocola aggregata]QDU26522.1 hypothetical protein ETAA8_16000 [Anatilimnocola aggregata]